MARDHGDSYNGAPRHGRGASDAWSDPDDFAYPDAHAFDDPFADSTVNVVGEAYPQAQRTVAMPQAGSPYGYADQQPAYAGARHAAQAAPRANPYAKPPRKRKGVVTTVIASLLMVCGIALICVAAGMYLGAQKEYQVGLDEYGELAANVSEPVDDVVGSGDGDATVAPIQVDFASLKAMNPQVVGWIRMPGTPINYPVAQGTDNDYYLDHTFRGQYNVFGSIFLDCRSDAALRDRVTVIYGHHLQNGEMFACIADLSDQAKFDAAGSIYYVTEDNAVHELTPLCTIVISGYDVDALQFSFADDAAFATYVSELLTRSSARIADADPWQVDHLYMLSTCSYATDNERTILVCTEARVDVPATIDADPGTTTTGGSQGTGTTVNP